MQTQRDECYRGRCHATNRIYPIVAACLLVSMGLGCSESDIQSPPQQSDAAGRRLSPAGAATAVADINRIQPGGTTLLYNAAFDLDVDAVRQLLANGADVNKGTEDGHTPLHVAAASESEEALEVVKILLSHGADINAKVKSRVVSESSVNLREGMTPLHEAAGASLYGNDLEAHSNIETVRYLLDHGADVNARDAWGYTPLFYAEFPDITNLLVDRDADLNVANSRDGGTVLHEAAFCRDLERVVLLVSAGADVHAQDFEGETPLHEAALVRDQRIVDYLVSQGAGLHVRSKRGETPQDFLDEPNDLEPILLSGGDTYPLVLIHRDRLRVRLMVKAVGINYDAIWVPSETNIDGLDESLHKWLEDESSDTKDADVDPDYMLNHFDEYHREYGGFVADGVPYVFSYMILVPSNWPVHRPLRDSYVSMIDGGSAQARVVFAASSRAVVALSCGWRPTIRIGIP